MFTTQLSKLRVSKRTTVYAETAYQITNSDAEASIDGTFGPPSGRSQFIGRLGMQTKLLGITGIVHWGEGWCVPEALTIPHRAKKRREQAPAF